MTRSFLSTRIAAILALITCAAPVLAQPAQPLAQFQARDVAYPAHGLEVGTGWNSFLAQKMPAHCVDVMEVALPKSEYRIDYDFVEDNYSLSEQSAFSVDGSYKGFGFRASVAASGARESRINRDYLSAMFTAQYTFGSTQATPVLRPRDFFRDAAGRRSPPELSALRYGSAIRLTAEAQALLEGERGLDRFLQTCGDAFVIAVHRGVRARVLVTLEASTQAAKQQFAAAVTAKGFGGALSADASSQTASSAESKKVSVQVFQEGGLRPLFDASQGAVLTAKSLGALFETGDLLGGESSFMATVLPYATLLDFAGDDTASEVLARYDALDDQRALFDFLTDLSAILAEIDRAQIVGQAREAWLYAPVSIEALAAERDIAFTRFQIFRLLRVLTGSMEKCYRDQVHCKPEVIQVPVGEQKRLGTQLEDSARALEREAAAIEARIEALVVRLAGLSGAARGDLRTGLQAWAAGGTDADAYLRSAADTLPLRVEAGALATWADDVKSLVSVQGPGRPRLTPGAEALVFERLLDPQTGRLGPDPLDTLDLPLAPDLETELVAQLRAIETALRAELEAARGELDAMQASAAATLVAWGLYYAPLVNFEEPFSPECDTLDSRRRTPLLPLITKSVEPEAPSLETIVALLRAGTPCATVALDDWVDTVYRLAAATPLTTAQLGLSALVASPDWTVTGTALEQLEARRTVLDAHLRWKIYAERLYPFRESLCRASIAEAYCVPNQALLAYTGDLNLTFEDAWLADPQVVEPPARPRVDTYFEPCVFRGDPGCR